MPDVKGTNTEQNLLAAFAGESQARNRYTYFASQAKKDGYEQIASIFEETANQEKEHAKRFFSMLNGGEAMITATFPAGVVGSTLDNLKAAAAGEKSDEVYWMLGLAYYPTGDFPSAAEALQRALALYPDRRRRCDNEYETRQRPSTQRPSAIAVQMRCHHSLSFHRSRPCLHTCLLNRSNASR